MKPPGRTAILVLAGVLWIAGFAPVMLLLLTGSFIEPIANNRTPIEIYRLGMGAGLLFGFVMGLSVHVIGDAVIGWASGEVEQQ